MGGFFGVVSQESCTMDLFYGTDYHSHLGTRRGGMATYNTDDSFSRSIHNLENSYFRNKFEPDLEKFTGNSGIGVISDTDPQPIVINSHLGRFAIVTVARITNMKDLEKELIDKYYHFSELSSGQTNPTELVALLINQKNNFVDGIQNVFDKVKGSCSMLILTENGIIAARDRYGRTPIVIGKKQGAQALAFESCSFINLGYEEEYFLGPGEIVHVISNGFKQLKKPEEKMQICSFLWVYYGYPVTNYENINVDEARYKVGFKMGETDKVDADFVSGIPDSGIGMALGYAEGQNIPYRRGIVKYTPTWPRSFTPANQKVRELVAKMKLIPNASLLKNKKIVFCDDSIVRGTQLRDNVNILYEYGAKEVHIRISCPPLLYSCNYINFSASKSVLELITRRTIQEIEGSHDKDIAEYTNSNSPKYCNMVECIRKKLNVTSLKFSTLDSLVSAIGLPKEQICTHCFDGSSYGD